MIQAFPDLLNELYEEEYMSDRDKFAALIESRFIHRFLQFFGFVMVDPRRFVDGKKVAPQAVYLASKTQDTNKKAARLSGFLYGIGGAGGS